MALLEGRTALITGAARGQGRAHAVALAREGANIVALDIGHDMASPPYSLGTEAELDETVRAVEEIGGAAIGVVADVRSRKDMEAAVGEATGRFGSVDVCVANAGILSAGNFWELTDEQWDETVGVNLTGVWRTLSAVAPGMMKRRRGSIVVTASVQAVEVAYGYTHYTAAKHGAIGVARSAALELGPYGVCCNVILPGSTDTGMTNWQGIYDKMAGHPGGTRDDLLAASSRYHALAPMTMIAPDEISGTVLWLASDMSAKVTGAVIPVDAGHLLLPGVNHRKEE